MTDQMERDLIDLFRSRADAVAPTPAPLEDLVRGGRRAAGQRRRARTVLAAAAAVAVAAVAVPLGLRLTDGDSPPGPAETPRVVNDDVERPATVDELPEGAPPAVPYIVAGELHVDDRMVELPEPAAPGQSLLLSGGDTVLYLRGGAPEAGVAVEILDGEELVPLFEGEVVGNVRLSADGTTLAIPTPGDAGTVRVLVTDLVSGEERSWTVDDPEQLDLLGVDDTGRALWTSDGVTYVWGGDQAPQAVPLPGGSVATSVAGPTVTTDAGGFGTISPAGEFEPSGTLPAPRGAIRFGTWSADGSLYAYFDRAVQGEGQTGAVIDATTGTETPLLVPADVSLTTSLLFEGDDNVLLTASAPGSAGAPTAHLRCSVTSGACDRILGDLPTEAQVLLPSR